MNENNVEQTMSNDVVKLVPDLIKVQTELKPVKKTEDNPYFKSKYAGLSSFIEEAQPILAKNNFAIVQQLGGTANLVSLTTTLLHTTGAWIKSTITMTPIKNDPQATGSCITYARRYGLQTLLGMATEDDDGNEASNKSFQQQETKVEAPKKTNFGAPVKTNFQTNNTPVKQETPKATFSANKKFVADNFNGSGKE